MKQKGFLHFCFDVLTALMLFLFILSFSVTFTLNFRPLYYMDIELLDIESDSGIPKDEIRDNYDALIGYNSMFTKEELEFPTLAMSETGKIHFEEVKVIFVLFQRSALITAILGLILIMVQKRRGEGRYLKYTGVITVVIPLLLGGVIAVNWDKAFVLFHKIAFDNDYWIFDPVTDPVITILPDAFFLHCAVMIIGLVVAGSVLCFVMYARFVRKFRAVKTPLPENE